MSDLLAPTIGETIRRDWLWIAAFLGITALIVWALSVKEESFAEPGIEEVHTITGFFVTANYGSGTPLVKTIDVNGDEFTARTTANIGTSCEVGDKIKVERRGLGITVGPDPCSFERSPDDD